jgi:CheY-like chemotaxis protein
LRCLGEAAFDLALLDDQFPDMDGWLLSELIRFDDDWNEMRVMLMSTANLQGNDGTTAVDGCLVKPVVPEVLLDEVAALLGVIEGPRRARMPIAQMAAQPKDGIAPRPVERQSECAPAHDAEFRVLLAEDNLVNQEVAVRMLSQLGCRIDVAANGVEALEMWRHADYDMIFMDCQMPELDGLEASRRIRQEEAQRAGRRTPIVAMTANAMRQDRSDCLAAGMDDYLSKPVSQDDLKLILAERATAESAGRGSVPV